jgi:hypothetical protein
MRLVACLTMCLIPILANAAQTDAQAPSDPQAYCVNGSADFYLYTGEPGVATISAVTRIWHPDHLVMPTSQAAEVYARLYVAAAVCSQR